MWRFFAVDFTRLRAQWLCQSRLTKQPRKRVSFKLDRSPSPTPSSSATELTATLALVAPRPPISVDIVVFLTSETTMTFEVEVIAGRSQRFYDINADKLQNLEKVFLSHCHAKSLSIRVVNVGGPKSKPLHTVNLSSFSCLKDLTRLELEMNDSATIQCDNPFLFRLNHLSLSKCQMTTYDFGILMNCLAGTLESLDLNQVSLVDSQCSQNVATLLGEMGRLYNLKSLKLDRTWSEFQKDSIRFTCPRLICLSLLKVNFEDLFSSALRTFTSTLMALVLTIEGRDYRITDVDALLHKFHEFAAKNYSTVKFGFKKRLRPKAVQPGTDAKTEFSFVLGWPQIEPSDTAADVSERVEEIFAFESLKVYVPARQRQLQIRSTPSPASSTGSSSPVVYESESFVTALETMSPSVEISAA
uniref:Uncharacterized protein n=1 Tax=Panagrellus redivivus TaxID=6233 RepID=A0A7E4V6I0_PANRE